MNKTLLVKNKLKDNATKVFIIIAICQLLTACASQAVSEISHFIKESNRAQWRAKLKWPVSCDQGVSHISQYDESFVGVEVHDWVAGQKLISVVCEAGAYQQGFIFYLQQGRSDNRYQLVNFPQFRLQKDVPTNLPVEKVFKQHYYQYKDVMVSGNLLFDNVTGRIRVDHFYRSGGGCGMSTTYSVLDKEASVVALRVKDNCDELDADISNWQKMIE